MPSVHDSRSFGENRFFIITGNLTHILRRTSLFLQRMVLKVFLDMNNFYRVGPGMSSSGLEEEVVL